MGLCFAMFVFLTFRGPLASHDSNPYPNRSRIARYNVTKARGALRAREKYRKLEPHSGTLKSSQNLYPKDPAILKVLRSYSLTTVVGKIRR